MPLNCGIVGLPNVGKSTIFNALTASKAQAANYPFCTIDPNVGIVPVPDERMDRIVALVKPNSIVPTTMEFVDIAGIVEGASKGEGLGNQFLSHIRQTDAILHVVRCFHDPEVIHVAGGVDPLSDMDVINTELMLADLDTVEKRFTKAEKAARFPSATPAQKAEVAALTKLRDVLGAGKPARTADLTDDERFAARDLFLITMKPQLYVANVDEDGIAAGNEYTAVVEQRAAEEGSEVVRICGAMEAEIAQLEPSERTEFLEAAGLAEPGLTRLIHAAYRLLGLITYFTSGGAGSARVDNQAGHQSSRRGRGNPLGLRARVHQGRHVCVQRPVCAGQRAGGEREGPAALGRQRVRGQGRRHPVL